MSKGQEGQEAKAAIVRNTKALKLQIAEVVQLYARETSLEVYRIGIVWGPGGSVPEVDVDVQLPSIGYYGQRTP